MPLNYEDRVKDQTNTTGTGSVIIDGLPPTGYRSIASAYTNGDTLRYTLINSDGTQWEVGEGVWTSATNTLTRATVYSSSNGGSLVNFSAGAKQVFTGPVAQDLIDLATLYAPKASPAFTGTPTAPTAAADTNTTQLATTAFVLAQAGSATPAALGSAAVGTSLRYARQDHAHAVPALSALSGVSLSSPSNTQLLQYNGTNWVNWTPNYLTGNQSITVSGDASGTGTTAISLTLANSGVSAGTYRSVTVDAKGRVTAGTNPTTISGYGITDAYTKTEVDGFLQGLDPKASVRAATTANITLSGTQTIDGVAVIAGDRVLVKDQSTASQNGIYVVAAGAWTRAVDMDVWTEVPGAYTFVKEGTTNADFGFVCTSNEGGTIGSTAMTWVQFNGATNITATGGITKSGNTLSLTTGVVTAGTYRSVTVDTTGRVTAGTNPTTLAGYGITDAAPLASPTFTGTPAAPTAAVDTNTTQLATTAYVVGQGYLKSATAASTYLALTGGTVSGSLTLSSGTANGVGYLNASKVLTSGSALTFDGTTLAITTNIKVGGGAASNTARLMVNTANGTAAGIQLFQDGQESWIMENVASGTALRWTASNTEYLRLTATGLTITGGLTFSGSNLRLLGDFTSATRMYVQTSTANGNTFFAVLPNGTSTNSQLQVFGASDPANAAYGTLTINATALQLQSAAVGTGTTLPIRLMMGATEAMRVSTGSRVLIGTTTDNGADLLQVAGAIRSTTGGFKFPDGTTQTTAATAGVTTGKAIAMAIVFGA